MEEPNRTAVDGAASNIRKFWKQVQTFKRNVTVEPVGFLMLMASTMSSICTQKLSLEKTCRVNLNFTDEICDSVMRQQSRNHSEYEREIQNYVTNLISLKAIIEYAIPALILVFLGAWSDLTGRRIVILIVPIVAHIFQCISNILNVMWFNRLPVEVLLLLDSSFHGIGGGLSLVFVGIYSFICQITTVEERTCRLSYVYYGVFISVPIGFIISGSILKNLGYYGYYYVYGICIALHIVNLIYVTLKLEDPQRSDDQKIHDNRGLRYFLRILFNLSTIKETIKVVFKNNSSRRRCHMLVIILAVTILHGTQSAEIPIMYMSTRYRFNWDELEFSKFYIYYFITHTIGTTLSVTVFIKYLNWHDSILGIISTISKIGASFVYCFAPDGKIFFIGLFVEILNVTSMMAMRSIVSKLVSPIEVGKVFSVFGITETLMPLLFVPLYVNVYKATMETLPGAVFLMGAALTFFATLVFIWLLFMHRREQKARSQDTEYQVELLTMKPFKKPLLQ